MQDIQAIGGAIFTANKHCGIQVTVGTSLHQFSKLYWVGGSGKLE